jgi:hypothetical protein
MTSSFTAIVDELRAVLARERVAIAGLDAAAVTALAAEKQRLADALDRARRSQPATPAIREAARALQIEVRANAMLAHAAREAVRALLGRQDTGYDRRARGVGYSSRRALAVY